MYATTAEEPTNKHIEPDNPAGRRSCPDVVRTLSRAVDKRHKLDEDVSAAEADVAAGRLTTHDEARAQVVEDPAT